MGENKCKNSQHVNTSTVSLFKITFLNIIKQKYTLGEVLVIYTEAQRSTEKF